MCNCVVQDCAVNICTHVYIYMCVCVYLYNVFWTNYWEWERYVRLVGNCNIKVIHEHTLSSGSSHLFGKHWKRWVRTRYRKVWCMYIDTVSVGGFSFFEGHLQFVKSRNVFFNVCSLQQPCILFDKWNSWILYICFVSTAFLCVHEDGTQSRKIGFWYQLYGALNTSTGTFLKTCVIVTGSGCGSQCCQHVPNETWSET